jgi:hypothetical protein
MGGFVGATLLPRVPPDSVASRAGALPGNCAQPAIAGPIVSLPAVHVFRPDADLGYGVKRGVKVHRQRAKPPR